MPFDTTKAAIEDIQQQFAMEFHGQPNTTLMTEPFDVHEATRMAQHHVQTLIAQKKGRVPADFQYATEVRINTDIQSFAPFMQYINVLPRKQEKGGSLTIGSQGRNTRTNDTYNGKERRVGEPKPSKTNMYEMAKAHFDFRVHDDDIDTMSEFPNWFQLYKSAFYASLGNDRLMIGWWGEKHVTTSDLTTHQFLQDVNIGWLELHKQRAPDKVLDETAVKRKNDGFKAKLENDQGDMVEQSIDDALLIGKGGNYENFDHFIQDLYQAIPLEKRINKMHVLVSEALLGAAEGAYYSEQGGTPTEKQHIQRKIITGTYGGLEVIPVPYLPQTTVVITSLKGGGNAMGNLSIYYKKESWRKSLEYVAKLESSIDWNARREAYHVEDLNAMAQLSVQRIIFGDFSDKANAKVTNYITKIPAHQWANL